MRSVSCWDSESAAMRWGGSEGDADGATLGDFEGDALGACDGIMLGAIEGKCTRRVCRRV